MYVIHAAAMLYECMSACISYTTRTQMTSIPIRLDENDRILC
jgi:hypothetical protein